MQKGYATTQIGAQTHQGVSPLSFLFLLFQSFKEEPQC